MANEDQISTTYDPLDRIWRAMLGAHPDITCALYRGDYSLSLAEAQRRKHAYVVERLGIEPGMRVLDIGCGWGPMLRALAAMGATGVGLTLSRAQAAYCQSVGLDAQLLDWRDFNVDRAGTFDAIVCIGAFEHFCSVEELEAGRQDQIYRDFFLLCRQLLAGRGRLFLQSMTWGARGVPNPRAANVHADRGSVEWILGHLRKFYPGSWLPSGLGQIVACAEGAFDLLEADSGRLDYIQTMDEWGRAARRRWHRILPVALRYLPRFIVNSDFRTQVMSMRHGCNHMCFRENIMDHFRMVFSKP